MSDMFCYVEKNFKTHSQFFYFFRPYVQVQAEAKKADVMKNTSKTKAAKQGFSYLDASQQTPAQTSTTPWGSKLDQNVPGAQMNAEDFTKQFMQDMYDGSAQAAGAGVQATSLTSTQAATLAVAQQEQQLKQQQTVSHFTITHCVFPNSADLSPIAKKGCEF